MTNPTSAQISDRLVGFVNAEIAVTPVEAETDLLLTGAVDSLGVIRITQWLEDELGVAVDPIDVTLENFQTITRMTTYATNKLSS